MPSIDPNKIIIEDRQRSDLGDVDELAQSIQRYGQISNIVITRDKRLVAGERRTRACQQLGIPVKYTYVESLSPHDLRAIELEENIKRKDLTWQETTKAVSDYHNFRLSEDPDWTQAQTADALNMTQGTVSKYLTLRPHLDKGTESVVSAASANSAFNVVERHNSRALDHALDNIRFDDIQVEAPVSSSEGEELPAPTPFPEEKKIPIYQKDFRLWAPSYQGPKFNFAHLDFPYGIDHGESDQGNAAAWGGYDDKPEVYQELITTFLTYKQVFLASKAHVICWLSFDNFFQWTHEQFTSAGFEYRGMLYWHKTDNKGILSDPNRRPRNIMETAVLFSLGDKRIVKPASNTFGGPTSKELHLSEKPVAMLEYFFKMFVDEFTTMLDPTCGSGNAVRVAKKLNANKVCGLEIDPENWKIARQAYRKEFCE